MRYFGDRRGGEIVARAWCCVVLSLGPGLGGCASKGKVDPRNAFLEGQQRAWTAQQLNEEPAVFFSGMVRNPRVPWTEGLTLARGLLAAEYTGALDPTRIQITREGVTRIVDVRRLLRGQDDPLLEPGDVVEVFR